MEPSPSALLSTPGVNVFDGLASGLGRGCCFGLGSHVWFCGLYWVGKWNGKQRCHAGSGDEWLAPEWSGPGRRDFNGEAPVVKPGVGADNAAAGREIRERFHLLLRIWTLGCGVCCPGRKRPV